MQISAYFFDKYTNESIFIAAVLWPLYFIPFYFYFHKAKNFNRNIIFPLVASLILASFTSLVFSDSLVEYVTYFVGVGILLFGSLSMLLSGKKSLIYFGIGILTTILASVILYLMRVHIYNRKNIPNTKGETNTIFTPGAFIWIGIQLILYIYIFYTIYNE